MTKLTDPQRRLLHATSTHYKVGSLLARAGYGSPGGFHFRDRSRDEADAYFGQRAARLADAESFQHRFADDA